MIQNPSSRSAAESSRRADVNHVEHWSQWSGRRHYTLEVVQHPIRARMCGFGDKDRRPLAPAVVAKMIVRREDNAILDVNEVDCSFFLVTVDLWSADGKREMNLVLHPSSTTDRYVPAGLNKSKRPRGGIPSPRSDHPSPPSSHSTPTSATEPSRVSMDPQSAVSPMMAGPAGYEYSSDGWGYPPTARQADCAQFQNQLLRGAPRNGMPAVAGGEHWPHGQAGVRADAESTGPLRGWQFGSAAPPQAGIVYPGQDMGTCVERPGERQSIFFIARNV